DTAAAEREQLQDAQAGVAEVEPVHPEAAEEDAEDERGRPVLVGVAAVGVAVRVRLLSVGRLPVRGLLPIGWLLPVGWLTARRLLAVRGLLPIGWLPTGRVLIAGWLLITHATLLSLPR